MTTHALTCYTLVCDGCNAEVYGTDEGPYHDDSPDDIRRDAQQCSEWTADGERDLCPSCTCANDGHRQKIAGSGFVYCDRCDETLLDSITVTPKAAYL